MALRRAEGSGGVCVSRTGAGQDRVCMKGTGGGTGHHKRGGMKVVRLGGRLERDIDIETL